jgi:glycosyltransferase involved in cell wall biosynthesis
LNNVSVVISVFSIDRAKDVVACIESLKKQTVLPKEIIVVLDPNNNLVSYYKKLLDSSVKLVVSDTFGLSAARNTGIKNCSSELIAFIDDDAVADKNWLRHLVSNFGNSLIIGVGGHIIPVWPNKNPTWLPEELYWIVGCSYKGLPKKKASIRNPIGCNMAFRRSVFENAGFFSTHMGRIGSVLMGHDDTEFGIRATGKLPETTIIYDPQAIVYHRVSPNRVNLTYVVRRSYSEGFSKAFISNNNLNKKGHLVTEKNYLRALFSGTHQMLLRGNVKTGPSRCLMLWIATLMVFLGYIVGSQH